MGTYELNESHTNPAKPIKNLFELFDHKKSVAKTHFNVLDF